jgi:hypothetical protein
VQARADQGADAESLRLLHIGHCNFDSFCLKQSNHWEQQKPRMKNKKKATPPQGRQGEISVMRILTAARCN